MEGKIRNFCIIAHIDHGKSTLADRFLELTGTVEKRLMKEQFLDQMELEREKGITIKLQPIRLTYKSPADGQEYMLNLIDTPGHVDFSYEVSRSLAAVEGAILLVDATKGIQAQTLANLKLAQKQHLVIIPAVNKVDLPFARTDEVAKSIAELLRIDEKEIFRISGKTGFNVPHLLEAVVRQVPAAKVETQLPMRALIFDSRFDAFKGVVAYVRVMEGKVLANEAIYLKATNLQAPAKEVGYFTPKEKPTESLKAGEIGYIATGIKEPDRVRIGDTITLSSASDVKSLAGYAKPLPVVFVSFYPEDTDLFDSLKDALWKLKLSDPSLEYEPESHEALGRGFRCGFLGVLHSEIISERIQREYGISLVISRPSVEYEIRDIKGKQFSVKTAADFPEAHLMQSVKEPWVWLEIITPSSYFSNIIQLMANYEGQQLEVNNLDDRTLIVLYEVPLREIVVDFYDKLKSVTQGMASMDYQITEWRDADLVKLEVLVAGEKEEAFSQIVSREKAYREGKALAEKLKDLLPPQQFAVPIQASADGKVIARETIRAKRKDVTAPLYGGDVTRKRKLLDRQKKGKKEMAEKGKIHIPSRVYLEVFRA
ncbi:MAG: elongation factor 4 [Candidatus Wildermuthbacteria bacterium RIFCSPHIGHO2_01_FULL_45_20]|uniref:Elongation factor 4 n=1 Tax=Candidatus Wildermuthbacteria bacterium RIFCSPHIGHO2_02_FULL_45_25 TaxID=1802450 RepID=A0A1G2R354_9BACT|nr:MAG: elongation factor 4 [Candidatus Wildermuthbacteria bacterium RIFCSPHIGHO2_01_FULL_45_20]OHA67314.1 MAG: elongation factor 4 [Candidatus Wildermuthbacteria bacterium RIFCSPHIGHO2_02_FULL_45_25]